jgi:hypothetical protein
MGLRVEIARDANASSEPSVVFKQLQELTPVQWNDLMLALQKGDREKAAEIFGATPGQMEDWFKQLKLKAIEILGKHPGLADPTKGFGK